MIILKDSQKIELLVNSLKVFIWQENGTVYRQIEGEEPEVQCIFENSRKGRLQAGSFIGGVVEGVKWLKTMF